MSDDPPPGRAQRAVAVAALPPVVYPAAQRGMARASGHHDGAYSTIVERFDVRRMVGEALRRGPMTTGCVPRPGVRRAL